MMEAWLRVRDELAPDAIEVEQLELVREPETIAGVLSKFLRIPPAEAERFRDALAVDRPERTARTFGQVSDFTSAGWSPSEIRKFKTICGAMMAAYGYGYDGNYYR